MNDAQRKYLKDTPLSKHSCCQTINQEPSLELAEARQIRGLQTTFDDEFSKQDDFIFVDYYGRKYREIQQFIIALISSCGLNKNNDLYWARA